MTQTLGGQPLNPTSSTSGLGSAFRMVGQAVSGVAQRLVSVSAATVLSNYVPNEQTMIGLDTAPDVPVSARSIGGRLPRGLRVAVLLYPPRGILVLGALDDLPPPRSIMFLASGSLTASQAFGFKAIKFRAWGGGGGSGGTAATGAGQSAAAAGGGGCGYSERTVPLSSIIFPVTVTVGTAGAAGGGGGNGGIGGTTIAVNDNGAGTVWASANGGGGGQAGPTGAVIQPTCLGGPGGLGTIGDLVVTGMPGSMGIRIAASIAVAGIGGMGAQGGGGGPAQWGAAASPGVSGSFPGGGAAGAYAIASQAAQIGAAGSAGLVLAELI